MGGKIIYSHKEREENECVENIEDCHEFLSYTKIQFVP